MGQRRVYRRQRRRMRQRHGRLQKEKHKFFSVIRDLRLDSIRCWAFVCSSGSVNDSVTREYERFRARYIYSYLCYPYFIILSFRPLYLLDSYIYLLLGSSSIYIFTYRYLDLHMQWPTLHLRYISSILFSINLHRRIFVYFLISRIWEFD